MNVYIWDIPWNRSERCVYCYSCLLQWNCDLKSRWSQARFPTCPLCWSPTQCQGLTLPGTVSPCSLQNDISPKLAPKATHSPCPCWERERRGGTALRCLGAVTVSTTKRVDKKGYCGQGGAGYPISITICLLCHGCFGVSKFCIDRLSCKCISVLVITWPYLTKYFWKRTYLKYLASSALLVKQQSSWLEYCHPTHWRRISQNMYVFCKLMIFWCFGDYFFPGN